MLRLVTVTVAVASTLGLAAARPAAAADTWLDALGASYLPTLVNGSVEGTTTFHAADIGGAKELAVRLKTAELRSNWATVWSLMVEKQRAYIPQGLFVRCMRNRTSPAAKSIAALSVATAKAAIPGSSGAKVSVSTVKVKVDFGKAAPSQTTAVRVVRAGASWFWITEAASKKDFTRRAFCG